MTSERDNPFQIAQQQFDTAAELLDLPQDIREVLRVPQNRPSTRKSNPWLGGCQRKTRASARKRVLSRDKRRKDGRAGGVTLSFASGWARRACPRPATKNGRRGERFGMPESLFSSTIVSRTTSSMVLMLS